MPQQIADAVDPVCGMNVNIEQAKQARLTTQHGGSDYYFCGKGCLLEFSDDPDRYLAEGYHPSM